MTASPPEPSSPFLRALEAARALGRADGLLAAGFEPAGEPAATGSCCHGLDPDDLARLVWDAGAGTPPAGVRLDAPLWYAQGFREGLAGARSPSSPEPAPDPVGHRQAAPGTPWRRGLPEPF
ncbi:hypothetical protein [Geodermatophilus sp. URMC 62]|uniref:hypothetical protein n=1 Tax=Geodermatophilus sp. URMC 62 TaxID=3423414 RepID=UPI00406CBFF1